MGKSSIQAVEEKLPPGFRFYPRDEELVSDYLMAKILMASDPTCTTVPSVPQLVEVDLNKSEPWEIPETASVGGNQWYFYTRRDKKYATGLRTNRATATGYWKATGKDRPVYRTTKGISSTIGMRKTLVFYRGRAPKGRKSDWVMHEFRLEDSPFHPPKFSSSAKEDWVLCRVFHKEKEYSSSSAATKQVSNTLPPLMDDAYATYGQSHTTNNLQQVPYFSICSHNQPPPYCYPAMVSASITVGSGAHDERNRGLFNGDMKVGFNQVSTGSSEHSASKLKGKNLSSEEFGGHGNHKFVRERYLAESMWKHQRY